MINFTVKKTTSRHHEQIEMRSRRFGYFPRTFVWRGHEYQVKAVEHCWTTGSRRNGGQMDRHHFIVSCDRGRFNLYQDLKSNSWWIKI